MKKQSGKKVIVIFLYIIIALSSSACAEKQDGKVIVSENIDKSEKTIKYNQSGKKTEEKTVIKLYVDGPLKEIELFNKTNEKYQVEVIDYYKVWYANENRGDLQPEDYLEQDIADGKYPDLIYWSYGLGSLLKKCGNQGLLADLQPFLKQEKELKLYNKDILKASKLHGKLYLLPCSFSFEVLLGNKKMMGDRQTWTMEEMQSFYDKLPKSFMYMLDIKKKRYLGDIFCYQQSDYINYNTGEINVETEDFMNILKFAKQLPEEEADIFCGNKWTEEKMIPKGQLLLTRERISDEYSIEFYQKRYKKTDGCNILSYPSIKNNGLLIDVRMFPAVIFENSEHKEGAWQVLRFLQSCQEESEDFFSVKTNVLKETLKGYKKKNRNIVQDLLKRVGRIRTGYALGFDRILSGGDDKESEEVIEIILNNAERYFRGKETVEKAAKRIQKKLEKYYQKWFLL